MKKENCCLWVLNIKLHLSKVNTDIIFSTFTKASGNMNSHYHIDNLLASVVNLFTAGTDTTSSTIRYGLLLMAKYPEVQGKRKEHVTCLITEVVEVFICDYLV